MGTAAEPSVGRARKRSAHRTQHLAGSCITTSACSTSHSPPWLLWAIQTSARRPARGIGRGDGVGWGSPSPRWSWNAACAACSWRRVPRAPCGCPCTPPLCSGRRCTALGGDVGEGPARGAVPIPGRLQGDHRQLARRRHHRQVGGVGLKEGQLGEGQAAATESCSGKGVAHEGGQLPFNNIPRRGGGSCMQYQRHLGTAPPSPQQHSHTPAPFPLTHSMSLVSCFVTVI